MSRVPLTLLIASLASATAAESQTLQAAPSTRATAEVSLTPAGALVGDTATPRLIRLEYGQPHLRGRTLHSDSLVPWGEPWRLGANAATTLRTDVPLTLGGVNLDPGEYVLEALPTRTEWTLLVARVTGRTTDGENQLATAERVRLQHRALHQAVESLSMWLTPDRGAAPARGSLRFAWGMSELSAEWVVR